MFGFQKKKQTHLLEISKEFDTAQFSTMYKEYQEIMKQLHKTETDNEYKQKTAALKEAYSDSVHSQKIAKKYREEYPSPNLLFPPFPAFPSKLFASVNLIRF